MKTCSTILCLALLSGTSAFAAETNSFNILSKTGAKAASVSYSLDKPKGEIKVHSEVDFVSDGAGNPRIYEYRVNKDGNAVSGTAGNTLDRTLTFYTPSKARDTLNIRITKNNSAPAGERTLTLPKPDFLIAFTDDPSIWQVLLDVDAAHPAPTHTYVFFVQAANAKTADRVEALRLNSPSESKGTLNGKDVVLKHYLVNFSSGTAEVYADADGKLMQVESGPLGTRTMVRTGFVLGEAK